MVTSFIAVNQLSRSLRKHLSVVFGHIVVFGIILIHCTRLHLIVV